MSTLICIQCSLKALLEGKPPPAFQESIGAHMARLHPDLEAMQRERQVMEMMIVDRLDKKNAADDN